MGDEERVIGKVENDEASAERAALRERIERLEQLVLTGEATLDDYGALALAQLEWQRTQAN
ncbi:MAG: hypothetical protein WDA15_09220 [Trueperaceae bacterium]|jgi:hypothetical protein